ncbi:hypothetical protein Maes01_01006 [Microbulbifer aestuariivivens]|uniref:FAD-binding PCMH-type domain-containing protein n=1 Tax=Microbulbifer aestuariivivens TaxID=1908308 RepID=A0ABP9WMK3_9GAMM
MADLPAAQDRSSELQQQVQAAFAVQHPLAIQGSGSRAGFGLSPSRQYLQQQPLAVAAHRGVIDYQPDELVIRARAGTRLVELEHLLASHGQRFAADIPVPSAESTLGGAVASGWDGPGRSLGVSLRDTVLGCRLINGRGDIVHFGGQVMKNVAGYDLSRLQVGALGTLGVILDVALRLAPLPETQVSRCFAVQPDEVDSWWRRSKELRPLLSASCYHRGRLQLRLSGRTAALEDLLPALGGEASDFDWQALRNLRGDFFNGRQLACLYVPPRSRVDIEQGEVLLDWEGARLWVKDGDHQQLQHTAKAANGFLRVLRGDGAAPLLPAEHWHRRLRGALDPAGILNPAIFREQFTAAGGR